jgi:hypothetical protein
VTPEIGYRDPSAALRSLPEVLGMPLEGNTWTIGTYQPVAPSAAGLTGWVLSSSPYSEEPTGSRRTTGITRSVFFWYPA